MTSLVRSHLRRASLAIAAGVGVWVFPATPGLADDGPAGSPPPCPVCHKTGLGRHSHEGSGQGTLGNGSPGPHPGFQGFGLGYHLGYGYGGDALGVGAEGGYPFYGGPGYPHPWPQLRRIGGITPFPHYGGPGGPSPACPNVFGGVGSLVPDRPVVTVEHDLREPGATTGYGPFSGSIPYPETTFAPFASMTVSSESPGGVSSASPPDTPPNITPAPDEFGVRRALGIDAEPVVAADRARGLKVTRVYPEGTAAKAGLRPDDVILSANGYVTEQLEDLAWIVANAAPGRVLSISVRAASEGEPHAVAVQLP